MDWYARFSILCVFSVVFTLKSIFSCPSLNNLQRNAINEIGFGNLMKVNVLRELFSWFVDNYDKFTNEFHIHEKSIRLKEKIVYEILVDHGDTDVELE